MQTKNMKTLGGKRVTVSGSFRPNGAAGIVAGSVKGNGFTVTRSSAGLYEVLFSENYGTLVDCKGFVRAADATPTIVQGGDYSASLETLKLRVLQEVATAGRTKSVPLDIFSAREIAANDIGNTAAIGGLLTSNTTPALARVNGATDKAARIVWAAGNSDEIQLPSFAKPNDLDGAQTLTVNLLLAKDTNTNDTATVDVQVFDGVGDTECGGATAALEDAGLTQYSVTVSAADLGNVPGILNVSLIPGAHANDAIYLYGAWISYKSTDTHTAFALTDLTANIDAEVHFNAVFEQLSASVHI